MADRRHASFATLSRGAPTLPASPHPLLTRLEAALERPLWHFLLLLAVALAFYGYSLSFGLAYDDRSLLSARHADWLRSAWKDPWFYRPLQALVFAPTLVSSNATLLHLENIVVGSLVVFLFGRLLLGLGLTLRLVGLIELCAVVLPTSMTSFVWISQRTEWLTEVCGLGLALLTVAGRWRWPAYVAAFLALSAGALFSKESGIGLIALAPALLALRHRRWRLALVVAVAGLALLAVYLALRSRFVVDVAPALRGPRVLAGALALGLVEVAVYSTIPVCFTSNALYLGLSLAYAAAAVAGLVGMWQRERPAATALLAVLAAFGLGAAFHAVPRNLAVTGMVVCAFAGYGAARLLEGNWGWGKKAVAGAVLAASLCSLANVSVFSSYALQDWVASINARLERLEPGAPRRGNLHDIEVNNRFRREVRERLRRLFGL